MFLSHVTGQRVFNFKTAGLIVGAILLASVSGPAVRAQNTQFLPEVDAYVGLNSQFRVYVQAKDDREGGDPEQFTFGPSIEFYAKPLVRLKRITLFDLDDSKSRPLILESGYRIVSAPGAPPENRAVEAATSRLPLFAGVLLTDRNRFDLDWKSGVFTWRYRNKLTIERTFAVASYHLIPYVAAEPFYESQYSKWSATDLYAGCLLPVGKHVQFNPYFEFENDTSKRPNRQQYYVGLIVQFHFSLKQNPK
jgi:hypothetical protein